MSGPLARAVLDDAIERYLAGEAQEQILSALGISATTLHRERTRRGIPPRREHVLPDAEIAAAYLGGESEKSLSRRYGVSRPVIRRRLVALGVPIRGSADAGRINWSRMTPEQRAAQVVGAHVASRGSKRTLEQRIAHAEALERIGRHDSASEEAFTRWLTERGESPIPQKAIGKYNVDLAVAPVAVEILGGGWHSAKRHHAVRTPEILNAGWHLAFVWDYEGRSALTEQAADYVVAWLDEVRRHPSAVGEYRVIAGNGELLARGRADDAQFALKPPPRGR